MALDGPDVLAAWVAGWTSRWRPPCTTRSSRRRRAPGLRLRGGRPLRAHRGVRRVPRPQPRLEVARPGLVVADVLAASPPRSTRQRARRRAAWSSPRRRTRPSSRSVRAAAPVAEVARGPATSGRRPSTSTASTSRCAPAPGAVLLCNPHNPIGLRAPRRAPALRRIVDRHRARVRRRRAARAARRPRRSPHSPTRRCRRRRGVPLHGDLGVDGVEHPRARSAPQASPPTTPTPPVAAPGPFAVPGPLPIGTAASTVACTAATPGASTCSDHLGRTGGSSPTWWRRSCRGRVPPPAPPPGWLDCGALASTTPTRLHPRARQEAARRPRRHRLRLRPDRAVQVATSSAILERIVRQWARRPLPQVMSGIVVSMGRGTGGALHNRRRGRPPMTSACSPRTTSPGRGDWKETLGRVAPHRARCPLRGIGLLALQLARRQCCRRLRRSVEWIGASVRRRCPSLPSAGSWPPALDALSATPAADSSVGLIATLQDVTEETVARPALHAAQERLWHLANHDSLTQLPTAPTSWPARQALRRSDRADGVALLVRRPRRLQVGQRRPRPRASAIRCSRPRTASRATVATTRSSSSPPASAATSPALLVRAALTGRRGGLLLGLVAVGSWPSACSTWPRPSIAGPPDPGSVRALRRRRRRPCSTGGGTDPGRRGATAEGEVLGDHEVPVARPHEQRRLRGVGPWVPEQVGLPVAGDGPDRDRAPRVVRRQGGEVPRRRPRSNPSPSWSITQASNRRLTASKSFEATRTAGPAPPSVVTVGWAPVTGLAAPSLPALELQATPMAATATTDTANAPRRDRARTFVVRLGSSSATVPDPTGATGAPQSLSRGRRWRRRGPGSGGRCRRAGSRSCGRSR